MDWRSLGNPHTKLVERAPHLGVPAAAVDAAGTVHVFVRDAVGSVRMRREGKGGKWEGWKDFKVRDTLDGMTAVATSTGRVEVLAPSGKATLRWAQEQQGGEPVRVDDIPLVPAPGSGTALETGPDRLTYYAADSSATASSPTARPTAAPRCPSAATPAPAPRPPSARP